ncbi:hypothetical protein AM587_10000855 [Phytophthora nicotianae]|uniref:Stomatin protein n=1 Tax=Phytophthora nicotianae TaxID=4792 RepID=A0A0W8DL19_PHYNI|nr:hypothetical protein AM587_10000855 [Phytophthora nicotianae]KUF96960.1 Stomatin protein [Phytophthora nicotianae]
MELAAVEKRLKSSEDAASSVEAPRLRVQRERKIAACEALKTQLEAMQATSGLFSVKQLAEIRAFAARVDKKKAYRKRAKLRRRVEMSIRRAANAKIPEKVESIDTDKTASEEESKTGRHDADAVYQEEKTVIPSLTPDSGCPEQSLDPETLTLDSLIQVRRAWDSYIVFPQTPGASTIPPVRKCIQLTFLTRLSELTSPIIVFS